MTANAFSKTVTVRPEQVIPAVTETTVTLTMDESTAFQLLAVLGQVGGDPGKTGRGQTSDAYQAIKTALDIDGYNINYKQTFEDGRTLLFLRKVVREDFGRRF